MSNCPPAGIRKRTPVLRRAGFGMAGAAILLWLPVSTARAAGGACAASAGTTTCTFASTGAEDSFTVPAGVSRLHVTAIGAAGAVSANSGAAGRGAIVHADLTVTLGQVLFVEVGGRPTASTVSCDGAACIGGFNGGGGSLMGGGGGGASDVRTVRSTLPGTLGSRLIVAGGGGGAGASGEGCPGLVGAAGGDAGTAGSSADPCTVPPLPGGTGGRAGSQSSGGAGGVPSGGSGSLGQGGDSGGVIALGGGGGGGRYGGGAGGTTTPGFDGAHPVFSPAGGGGGGSSLIPAGGTAALTTAEPSVTISYATPVPPNFTADNPPATGTVGVGYSYRFTATGVPAPTFTGSSGILPAGMSLNRSTGVLSGTPTTPGISTFTITASNAIAPNAIGVRHSITISPAVTQPVPIPPAPTLAATGSHHVVLLTLIATALIIAGAAAHRYGQAQHRT